MTTTEWRALIRQLRKRFPIDGVVVVIRRKMKCNCGLAVFKGFDGYRYRICVDSDQTLQGQVDTLLHEWAHVCAIEEAHGHRGCWGRWHGDIYDSWTKDFQP